jgi:hypothetical protein
MQARKVVNRVYRGVTYYRWILSISPKDIQQLGWVDGQPLHTYVRGSTLLIEPSTAARSTRRSSEPSTLEGTIRRRSFGSELPSSSSRSRRE